MQLPFVSRKRYDDLLAEFKELRQSISKVCNTGCRTAKCRGEKTDADPIKTNGSRLKHTHARRGKRVRVTLHAGEQFVAKLKDTEGRFHLFYDHDKVKSKLIKQVSVLRADYRED